MSGQEGLYAIDEAGLNILLVPTWMTFFFLGKNIYQSSVLEYMRLAGLIRYHT